MRHAQGGLGPLSPFGSALASRARGRSSERAALSRARRFCRISAHRGCGGAGSAIYDKLDDHPAHTELSSCRFVSNARRTALSSRRWSGHISRRCVTDSQAIADECGHVLLPQPRSGRPPWTCPSHSRRRPGTCEGGANVWSSGTSGGPMVRGIGRSRRDRCGRAGSGQGQKRCRTSRSAARQKHE